MKQEIYYKVLTSDLKSPNNTKFDWSDWESKTFSVEGTLEMCSNGIHLYKSLNNLSIGNFGSRVFEAQVIGEEILEGDDKICVQEVKLIKEIDISLVEDNEWIYYYCRDVQDRKELWSKLTDEKYIYRYCIYVKDRKELWSKLTNEYWIYSYCRDIKDREELWSKLTDNEWIYYYCLFVQDREELWSKLTNEQWIFYYCKDIQDREELWSKLTDEYWIFYSIVKMFKTEKNSGLS